MYDKYIVVLWAPGRTGQDHVLLVFELNDQWDRAREIYREYLSLPYGELVKLSDDGFILTSSYFNEGPWTGAAYYGFSHLGDTWFSNKISFNLTADSKFTRPSLIRPAYFANGTFIAISEKYFLLLERDYATGLRLANYLPHNLIDYKEIVDIFYVPDDNTFVYIKETGSGKHRSIQEVCLEREGMPEKSCWEIGGYYDQLS